VLAAACLFLRCGRGVTCIEKPVQILAVVMLLFSMGLVGYSIYLLTDASESNAGPDAENFNDKEEKAYEVAGAGLGLVSAIFHVVMWQCCSTKKNKNGSDSGDDQ
jgi:hypothetical protein